jgi:hypothetical protein
VGTNELDEDQRFNQFGLLARRRIFSGWGYYGTTMTIVSDSWRLPRIYFKI